MMIFTSLLAFVVMIINFPSESVKWVRLAPLNLGSYCREAIILEYMTSESILKMIIITSL